MSVKNKATETPQGMYYIHALDITIRFLCVVMLGIHILIHLRGAFQRCTLKDDISYLLPT